MSEDQESPQIQLSPQLTWDDVMTRRVRSLLWVGPFHALRRGEAFRDEDISHYDTLSLAMKILEIVIYSMGLGYGITRKSLLHEITPLLIACDRASQKDINPERHARIVDVIVGGLINESGRRKHFEETYIDFSEGKAQRRVLSFQIITEEEAPDGSIVLRARPEGINLFTKSFDVDIEDAQAAVEAVVLSQIRRGRIDLAVSSAWEACVRSMQFEDKIKRVLEVTRRDIRQVDWQDEVPGILRGAFNHLTERLSVEREILDTCNRHLDTLMSLVGKKEVVKVIEILQDCQKRHLDLHRQLLDVRNTFLKEQERQRFAPISSHTVPDLQYELLLPALEMTQKDARKVTNAFFISSLPPYPPPILTLDVLLDKLMQPKRIRNEFGEIIDEEGLNEVRLNTSRFKAETHEQVKNFISSLESSSKLSVLIQNGREAGWSDEALILMVLEVLRLYDPEIDEEADNDEHFDPLSLLVVTKTGETLCDPLFTGDDLMIVKHSDPAVLPDSTNN